MAAYGMVRAAGVATTRPSAAPPAAASTAAASRLLPTPAGPLSTTPPHALSACSSCRSRNVAARPTKGHASRWSTGDILALRGRLIPDGGRDPNE